MVRVLEFKSWPISRVFIANEFLTSSTENQMTTEVLLGVLYSTDFKTGRFRLFYLQIN